MCASRVDSWLKQEQAGAQGMLVQDLLRNLSTVMYLARSPSSPSPVFAVALFVKLMQ